jgi:hypothetical protein
MHILQLRARKKITQVKAPLNTSQPQPAVANHVMYSVTKLLTNHTTRTIVLVNNG